MPALRTITKCECGHGVQDCVNRGRHFTPFRKPDAFTEKRREWVGFGDAP